MSRICRNELSTNVRERHFDFLEGRRGASGKYISGLGKNLKKQKMPEIKRKKYCTQ